MAKKGSAPTTNPPHAGKPSALLDIRVVYCGDNLEQLAKLPDHCVDLIYIDSPFNSNRTVEIFGEVFRGETKAPAFEDRHASMAAYIDYMRRSLRATRPPMRPQGNRQLLLSLRLARLAIFGGERFILRGSYGANTSNVRIRTNSISESVRRV